MNNKITKEQKNNEMKKCQLKIPCKFLTLTGDFCDINDNYCTIWLKVIKPLSRYFVNETGS